jgi:OmpA-OmpF porin, OOP family
MKKQLIVALLGTALALPIVAQAEGAYVGVNVGRSEIKAEGDKDHDTAFKLNGGYDFDKTFGIEAGYVDLGKFNDGKVSAFYVAGTGNLAINEQFSLFAKIGFSADRVKLDRTNEKFNNTSAIIGVGAAYNFSKTFSLVGEYENFGKVYDENDGSVKADMFSVGLRYKF